MKDPKNHLINEMEYASHKRKIMILKQLALNAQNKIDSNSIQYATKLILELKPSDVDEKLCDISNLISQYYKDKGLHDKSLEYAKKVLQHHQSLNNQRGIAQAFNNIGIIYSGLGEINKAIEYFRNSLTIKKELGDDWRICNTLLSIAECHKQNSQIEAAIHSYLQAKEYAEKAKAKDLLSSIFLNLSELYKDKQDHEKAYEYLKEYIDEDKKIHNLETEKQITRLRTKFEIEKKEKENEIYRLKNIELAKANATKDKFFSIISHDLRSPFASLQSYTNLLLKHINEFSKEDIVKYTEDLNKTIQSTNQLLENLLTWSRFNSDEMPFQPENLELHQIVEQIYNSHSLNMKLKEIRFENWLTKDISVFADHDMMKAILRNLISNAVKFTSEKGKIVVNASKVGDYVEITVKDSGVGIDKNHIKGLFNLKNKRITRGTNYEKGTGLGLILCKEFVKKNGGTINAESVVGKGSIFTITIPGKR